MIYDHRKGSHDSLPTVLLYACPNVNAEYTADDINRYRRVSNQLDGEYSACTVCGKVGRHHVHHEPPKSKGSLHIVTAMGTHIVKPTLMTLCMECHRDRHDRAALSFAWEFDSPDDELAFLTGEFFKAGWKEHDRRFWELGRLIVSSKGRRWEIRR